MRKVLTLGVAISAAGVLLAGPAFAGHGSSESKNEVTCGPSTVPTQSELSVYAGSDGIEVCNDGSTFPIQGRVTASGGTGGGYIAVDGDESNPEQGRGYVRIDITPGAAPTYRCGDTADDDDKVGGRDAANPTENETSEDCG